MCSMDGFTRRGFGGTSYADWAGDLTAAERTLAFGNADGQLGFSVLRIPVTIGAPDSSDVATARAAIAAGAIVPRHLGTLRGR
jgi:glucuronoarabinoxylan endo-1,4-beta-xylanase